MSASRVLTEHPTIHRCTTRMEHCGILLRKMHACTAKIPCCVSANGLDEVTTPNNSYWDSQTKPMWQINPYTLSSNFLLLRCYCLHIEDQQGHCWCSCWSAVWITSICSSQAAVCSVSCLQ